MRQPFLKNYKMKAGISSYCKISANTVWVNGNTLVEESKGQEPAAFLAALYKKLDLNYPKFFKMDNLCKLGILATEYVIRNTPAFEDLPKDEIALVFSNQSSSMESDRKHLLSIGDKKNYFPSPSVFVYTLPNIVIGEIAIRHKLSGENAFFVSGAFDADLIFNYSTLLMENSDTSAVLCAWVEVDGNKTEAFVYCVKKGNFNQESADPGQTHSPDNIRQLYTAAQVWK